MKTWLSAFLLLTASALFAQGDNPDNVRARIFELTVKTVPPDTLRLPFESIKVIDSRFDTSKLGYRISTTFSFRSKINVQKIVLRPGIATGIENFFNEYYRQNFTRNGKTLLISIKRLWINNVPRRQGKNQRKDIDRRSQQDIYARFEYYFGSQNAYVPLKRVDTVFQLTPDKKVEDYDPKDENKLPFFCFALEKMVENVNYTFYIEALGKKNKMSLEDIDRYNATLKDIPILKEPVKKGVFLTFSEFKNNQPSITSFSKRKLLKKKIYEIIDERENVILDYFAYYDGEKLAVAKQLADLSGSNISQDNYGMYKVNNSFQFYENYFRYTGRESNAGTTNENIPSVILIGVPRQLDMETGEIY